jgi:hypothetical protein
MSGLLVASVIPLTACGAAGSAAHDVGRAVAHVPPARQVAENAATRARWSSTGELLTADGRTWVPVSRSAVIAEAAEIAGSRQRAGETWTELERAIKLACLVKDGYGLATANKLHDQIVQAAGMARVPAADVYGLVTELQNAKDSGESTRIWAAYLLCNGSGEN